MRTRPAHLASIAFLLSIPAAAGPPDPIARLEDLLDAQQRRIESLQSQLAAQSAESAEAQRTEAMRAQIREILRQPDFRESLVPAALTAGYEKGFYLRSSDDRFLLRVGGRLQTRFTHAAIGSRNRYLLPRLERDDRTGFDVRRVRLVLKGHAGSPDLTYYLQLSADAPDAYDSRIRDAFVNYRFADAFQFQAGIFKVAAMQSQC